MAVNNNKHSDQELVDTSSYANKITNVYPKHNTTLPWIEKYRPQALNQVLSHDNIISVLKKFINNKCLPHLLFHGPSGTGKTTTITAVAKELYGKYYQSMVMELNASDDRGIEPVRDKIKKFVMSQNAFFDNNMFKLVILDETDAMTSDAQAILRKIMEEHMKTTRFCLICNYIQNISPALQSRSTKFRFSPIGKDMMEKKIIEICSCENIPITNDGINTIIKRSNGDMRKTINILQSVSMTYNVINEKNINTTLAYPRMQDMNEIFDNLINKNFKTCYENILSIKTLNGLSLADIINEIHNILVEKLSSNITFVSLNKLTTEQIIHILDKLRIIEFNHSSNTLENIQLSGLISIFKIVV